MNDGRYYWLKLKRDFFKRHDIRIVEEMPNGKEYILFYLKLLCESVDHEGNLRFSDEVPYNESMLSTITNTNLDIVRSAVKLFTELHMMEILTDGTIFMREVDGMIGSATNNDNALRQARYRERQKLSENTAVTQPLLERYENVTNSNESKSKRESKSKSKNNTFVKPTIEEIQAFIKENTLSVDAEYFRNYYESNGWMVGKVKMKDWKATLRNWSRREAQKPGVIVIPKTEYNTSEQTPASEETLRKFRERQSNNEHR